MREKELPHSRKNVRHGFPTNRPTKRRVPFRGKRQTQLPLNPLACCVEAVLRRGAVSRSAAGLTGKPGLSKLWG